MFDLTGKTIGPYRILDQIGIGGMAVVYKAYQPSMDRYVAVKVLPSHLSQDPDFVKRFQREARAIARLEHAHILPVHDYGEFEGVTYLVMRYVQAGTLKERMVAGPPSLDEVNRLIGQIGSALDYAHRMGIIHRDVKPGNILVDIQGDTYLTDFGLARILEPTQQITASGVGLGTPAYMSPEQGQGVKVDHRSDIYSLGVILYEMLTGRVPYEAETPMAVVLKHITAELPLPRTVNPNVPEAVERVILKSLAKELSDRFQTAGELAQALTEAVRQVGAETAKEPIARLTKPTPTATYESISLFTRIQKAWQQPWGKIALVGGLVSVVFTLGFLLSRLEGNIAIVGPETNAIATLAITQHLQLASPTAARLTTPTAAVSELSPGVGYGKDVFRRAAITSLAVNPTDPETVFVATNGAGIYISHDAGKTWIPSNEGLGKAKVAQIVIDPNNSNILYAAMLSQGGVYKSTNGGQTWRAINLGIDLSQAWGWSAFIAIAPGDSNRLYYSGATNGLYLSGDGGESWQRISGYCPLIGGIAVDPKDANHIYLAAFDTTGMDCPSRGIYESTDGGQTLTHLTTDEMLGPAGDDWHLAVHTRDFKTLYAGSSAAVYKSGNGGRTWTPIRFDRCDWLDANPEDGTVYCGQGGTIQISHDEGQSWTSTSVGSLSTVFRTHPFAVTPGDPGTIYAGVDSVMKSTDGAQTWLPVGQLGVARLHLTIDPRSSQSMFLSVMDNPCDTYRSEDGGKTWLPIIRNGSVCRITIDPSQGILYHHSEQSGQLQRSKDNGQTWELFSADIPPPHNILEVVVDPQDSQRLWAIGRCGTFLYVSQDGGFTFTELKNFPQDLCDDSFIMLDSTGQRIYVSGWGNILRSDDGGQSWVQLANLGATSQVALDPSNSNVLYVGTTYKGLLKTTTAGQSWSKLSNLPATSVNDIAIDPANPQTVYAATDSGVFVSLDGGGGWSRIQDDLGSNPVVYSIEVDPNDSSEVYAVTPDGVYRLGGTSPSTEPLNSQAGQARAFAEPILAAIADRPPDFEDDFSADDQGWVTDSGCGQIIDGRLRTNILNMDQTTCGVHNSVLDITNFVFEIDLTQSHTEVQGTAGVQWRHTSTGLYGVYVDVPGQRWELQIEHVPDATRDWSGPASGRLRVIGLGDQFAVYINNTPIFYLQNDLYSNGAINFNLNAGIGPITVEFDNIKLWNLDNVPALP